MLQPAARSGSDVGGMRYVAWGRGSFKIPQGATEYTGVVPAADGSFTWQAVREGEEISLSEIPVLVR